MHSLQSADMEAVCNLAQERLLPGFERLLPNFDPTVCYIDNSFLPTKETIDGDLYRTLAVSLFALLLIPSIELSQTSGGPVKFKVTPIHRITGALLGVCTSLFINRAHILCLLESHCNGRREINNYHHLIPVIWYLCVLPLFGLFVVDLSAGLKHWIDRGGFTTRNGLKETAWFLSSALAVTGGIMINQYTFPDWRELSDPNPQLVLKCLICVISIPQLTWYLVGSARRWYSGNPAISKAEDGLREPRIQKVRADDQQKATTDV